MLIKEPIIITQGCWKLSCYSTKTMSCKLLLPRTQMWNFVSTCTSHGCPLLIKKADIQASDQMNLYRGRQEQILSLPHSWKFNPVVPGLWIYVCSFFPLLCIACICIWIAIEKGWGTCISPCKFSYIFSLFLSQVLFLHIVSHASTASFYVAGIKSA